MFPDQLAAFDGDNLPTAVGFLADFQYHGYTELPKPLNMTTLSDRLDSADVKDDSFEEQTCRRLAEVCGKRFVASGKSETSKTLIRDANYGVAHATESASGASLGLATTTTTLQPRFVKTRRRRKPRVSRLPSTISPAFDADAAQVTPSDVDDDGNEQAFGVHQRRVNLRKMRSVRAVGLFDFQSGDDRDVDVVVTDEPVVADISATSVDISKQLGHTEESASSTPYPVSRHRNNGYYIANKNILFTTFSSYLVDYVVTAAARVRV